MTREAMGACLRVLKESKKVAYISYSVRNSVLIRPLLPFGIVTCTFFQTTFLEIAAYAEANLNQQPLSP